MILSHKYKFIFIKTQRTAGTSIEVYLSQLCGSRDVVTPITPHVPPHNARNYRGFWFPFREILEFIGLGSLVTLGDLGRQKKFYNHLAARRVRTRIPLAVWDNYYKFCVERNPWDKTLSHYAIVNDYMGNNLSFDQYLTERKYPRNDLVYTNRMGNIIVDKVIRYEDLNKGLSLVFGQLGVPFQGKLEIRAKSKYRKDRRPYQEVYTPTQRDLVAKFFAQEIKLHGYKF